jgi:hypothetical protein
MKFMLRTALIAGFFILVTLRAQGPGASVTGEVRDPSGAIVADAKVTSGTPRRTSTAP